MVLSSGEFSGIRELQVTDLQESRLHGQPSAKYHCPHVFQNGPPLNSANKS